jgi:RimJ/RimL family protein N-acetyltransferase
MEVLTSKRIKLRALSETDQGLLYEWRNTHEYIKLVSPQRAVVGYEDFVSEIKKGNRHLQFMIETDKPVGFIYSFGLNLTDGYVFMNTFIEKSSRQKGYGAEAGTLLTCFLFDTLPLFKIYYEAFGYNAQSLSLMRTAGLKEEGSFRGHRFWEGEHHDVIRFASYRDGLSRIRRLQERFKAR